MKFICLGYLDQSLWSGWSEEQQKKFITDCFAYDDFLRKNNHFTGGEALQGPECAKTIRGQNGKISVTDGPFAETKEQIGGIMILEAKDIGHAVELMSNHPSSLMGGTWEIRPANEQINRAYQEDGKYSMDSSRTEK
jgi:hypothetical protein